MQKKAPEALNALGAFEFLGIKKQQLRFANVTIVQS